MRWNTSKSTFNPNASSQKKKNYLHFRAWQHLITPPYCWLFYYNSTTQCFIPYFFTHDYIPASELHHWRLQFYCKWIKIFLFEELFNLQCRFVCSSVLVLDMKSIICDQNLEKKKTQTRCACNIFYYKNIKKTNKSLTSLN